MFPLVLECVSWRLRTSFTAESVPGGQEPLSSQAPHLSFWRLQSFPGKREVTCFYLFNKFK